MRKLPRNIWIVTATSFLTDISSEMLVHLLPLFLANILGVRTSVIGLIEGVAEGAGKALVADLVQPAQRGTAYGVYNAAIGLAAFPASLIAGLLWQGVAGWAGFGPAAPFLFGAAMALIAVLLLLRWAPAGAAQPIS